MAQTNECWWRNEARVTCVHVCTLCMKWGNRVFLVGGTGQFKLSKCGWVHLQHRIKSQDSGTILQRQSAETRQQSIYFLNLSAHLSGELESNRQNISSSVVLASLQIASCLATGSQALRKMRRSLSWWVWGDTYHRHCFCRCCRALSPAGSGMLISSSSQLLRELQSPDKDLLQRLNCESHLLRNYMCCGKGRRKRGRSEIITYTSH